MYPSMDTVSHYPITVIYNILQGAMQTRSNILLIQVGKNAAEASSMKHHGWAGPKASRVRVAKASRS